jgi:hypothetical protein
MLRRTVGRDAPAARRRKIKSGPRFVSGILPGLQHPIVLWCLNRGVRLDR